MLYKEISATIANKDYSGGILLLLAGLILMVSYLVTTATRGSTWRALVIVIFSLGLLFGYFFWGPLGSSCPEKIKFEVFRDLLIIILAISAIFISLLGWAAYRIVESRTMKRSEEFSKELMGEIYLKSLGNALCNLGLIFWKNYKEHKVMLDLEHAIELTNDALQKYGLKLDKTRAENKKIIIIYKNNLAFYLAEYAALGKADSQQKNLALEYANYVYSQRINLPEDDAKDIIDTYDYVQKHCKQ